MVFKFCKTELFPWVVVLNIIHSMIQEEESVLILQYLLHVIRKGVYDKYNYY